MARHARHHLQSAAPPGLGCKRQPWALSCIAWTNVHGGLPFARVVPLARPMPRSATVSAPAAGGHPGLPIMASLRLIARGGCSRGGPRRFSAPPRPHPAASHRHRKAALAGANCALRRPACGMRQCSLVQRVDHLAGHRLTFSLHFRAAGSSSPGWAHARPVACAPGRELHGSGGSAYARARQLPTRRCAPHRAGQRPATGGLTAIRGDVGTTLPSVDRVVQHLKLPAVAAPADVELRGCWMVPHRLQPRQRPTAHPPPWKC